jgi:hypothetical protein
MMVDEIDKIAYGILFDEEFWTEIAKKIDLEKCNKIAIDTFRFLMDNYADETTANVMFALLGLLHNIIKERTVMYIQGGERE